MRKLVIGSLALAAFSAMADVSFPYVEPESMHVCHETNGLAVASLDTAVPVPKIGEGMLDTNSVATVCMTNTFIQAMDPEDWVSCTNAIAKGADPVQAAFSLVTEEGASAPVYKWMGYTGGNWVELTGDLAATDGVYDVKIDLDYSLTKNPNGATKIRYSVRKGSTDYVVLGTNSVTWLATGTEAKTKVNGVDIYGFMTNVNVVATAGSRELTGDVRKAADISINYDTMDLYVLAEGTWGVDKVKVTLKNELGGTIATIESNYVAGVTNAFALSEYIQPGGAYTYDVELTGTYGNAPLGSQAETEHVNLFSTNSWFYFSGTEFVHAVTNGNITVADSKFYATDDEQDGTISPTNTPKNIGTIVTTTMEISNVCAEMPDFEESERPQFAIALGTNGTADVNNRVWKYYDGTGQVWRASAATGLTVSNGIYEGRATFNYTNHVVKYEIRSLDEAEFKLLVATALPNAATALSEVAIRGGGSVRALDAQLKLAEPEPVVPTGSEIVIEKNATVDLTTTTAGSYTVEATPGAHLKWTDSDGKFAKMSKDGKTLTVSEGTPANGLTSYNSYVLGLDATKQNDKPAAVIKPGQDQSNGMKLYVPNVNPPVDSGCTPMLQLQSKDGDGEWTNVDEPVSIGSDVTVPLGGSLLYRVNTIIK